MTEQWKTDFDQRQFTSMEEQLRRYEQGATNLGSLIAGLEALLLCLERADENWKTSFQAQWGVLEEVYAIALDRVEQGLSPNADTVIKEADNQRLVATTIEKIRHLIGRQGGDEG